MSSYEQLLSNNKHWAKIKIKEDPDYFERLVNVQKPEFLWIGCSDSRVPPNEITQTKPGEMFIHRNVANLVISTDMNLISVLQYAVEVLNIKHIIICGHYGCGGVTAAMSNKMNGVIDFWLTHIKDVYRLHSKELEALPEENNVRLNRLTELNIQEQALNLSKTNIVQKAWLQHDFPHIHGWVYDLHDGIIKPVCEIVPSKDWEDSIYQFSC